MKIEMTEDSKNALYDRRDITATVGDVKATPSRAEVTAALAKETGAKPECIVIDAICQRFGRRTATVKAKVYESADNARKYEKAYKFTRAEKKAAKKEGEAAPEAPAEKKKKA